MRLADGVKADATLSPCGTWRYALTRDWWPKRGAGHVLWVMLNPSTADADQDDPTVRRCQTFARTWGFDGVTVANLFALRSTDPGMLRDHPDPVGPANDDVLEGLFGAVGVGLVVAAWGVHGRLHKRHATVVALAGRAGRDLYALGVTKGGDPRHPLYVRGDAEPVVWRETP